MRCPNLFRNVLHAIGHSGAIDVIERHRILALFDVKDAYRAEDVVFLEERLLLGGGRGRGDEDSEEDGESDDAERCAMMGLLHRSELF